MPTQKDSMGTIIVPEWALWGASTQRAIENFPKNGPYMPLDFIRAIGLIKWASAKANLALELISEEKASCIMDIALSIYEGKLAEHFFLSIFQTGSATSSNMNVNEVICNQATFLKKKIFLHPNDDVNKSQSSNDTMPAALHISTALSLKAFLIPSLEALHQALLKKSNDFENILKIGRTHLMDATPISLGQEFSGYARQIEKGAKRAQRGLDCLLELAIGGTAVGTGINCPSGFAKQCISFIAEKTKIPFYKAENPFEAQAARDDCAEVAGFLSTICGSLIKIANDIRLMGSGPRAGIFELSLPELQPGSSIMPGKTNPVMCEMLIQASLYTIGQCQTVIACAKEGQFELNTTIPLLAHSLLSSIHSLSQSIQLFTQKCILGLEANLKTCKEALDTSLMLVTALNEHIGYDMAATVAKKAFQENKSLKQVLLELKLMDAESIDKALDPRSMI